MQRAWPHMRRKGHFIVPRAILMRDCGYGQGGLGGTNVGQVVVGQVVSKGQ